MAYKKIKLTKARAKYFAKEEAQTSRLYARMGLKEISEDEKRHSKFFKAKASGEEDDDLYEDDEESIFSGKDDGEEEGEE